MKKTMFKRIFAGIAAMFMMCLFLPIGFTGTDFKPSLETAAESGGWQEDMFGREYKIEGDTLIINNCKQSGTTSFDGFFLKSYAADINHLEIGSGWEIGLVWLYLSSIQSLKVGDNCTIKSEAFRGCTALESVEIGNNCTIGEKAFWGYKALESVTIGNDCTIGECAFWNCTALEIVEIGNGCTIGELAFWYCAALKNVTIGDNCTIKSLAFDECYKIKAVVFTGKSIDNVNVNSYNPAIIRNMDGWYKCNKPHTFNTDHKCTVCGYECQHIKSCDTNHKCKLCGFELDKQHTFNENYTCTICRYFDKATAQAEIEKHNAEIEKHKAEIEKHNAEIDRIQKLIDKNESDNNTASTISNGNPIVLIFGGIALIIGCIAAAIIVKRMKKTE